MDKANTLNVLLVGRNQAAMSAFKAGLEKNQVETAWAESGKIALIKIADANFDLIVADEQLGDMSGLQFIEKVILDKPMINCAAVTSLSHSDFHEASEGLGILMPLPVRPGQEQAEKLLDLLKNILNLARRIEIK
jgi:CheY-like chemotaxis protein